MKKLIGMGLFALALAAQVAAFTYPADLFGLFQKYRDEHTTLHVVTLYIGAHQDVYKRGDVVVAACKEYDGQIIVAAGDYITFKMKNGDVVIIPYTAIVEVSEE